MGCPKCNRKGMEVKSRTVSHLVDDELAEDVKEGTYFVCMNEECNTVYFSPDLNRSYSREQMKIPMWFKKDADPKYICYCNGVTEGQIMDAVLYNEARDMKDIVRLTGAMKNSNCETRNPLGKCCGQLIQETINKAMKIKEAGVH